MLLGLEHLLFGFEQDFVGGHGTDLGRVGWRIVLVSRLPACRWFLNAPQLNKCH
jgi:hypothetical protein